jgi:nucleoside-diphosphate-sugar epimerase
VGRMLKRGVPLSRYRIESIRELRFDCSRAQEVLGWTPAIGVNAGLRTGARLTKVAEQTV